MGGARQHAPSESAVMPATAVRGHDVIIIGGSAGSLQPMCAVLERITDTIAAAIFVDMHASRNSPRLLPGLLGRRT